MKRVETKWHGMPANCSKWQWNIKNCKIETRFGSRAPLLWLRSACVFVCERREQPATNSGLLSPSNVYLACKHSDVYAVYAVDICSCFQRSVCCCFLAISFGTLVKNNIKIVVRIFIFPQALVLVFVAFCHILFFFFF